MEVGGKVCKQQCARERPCQSWSEAFGAWVSETCFVFAAGLVSGSHSRKLRELTEQRFKAGYRELLGSQRYSVKGRIQPDLN